MAIQINVNPQGLDTLSQNLTQLVAKLDEIANSLSTGGAKESRASTRKAKSKEEETPIESSAGAIQQETKKQRSPIERLDSTMQKSHTVQMSLTKSLDELNKSLTRMNRGARGGGIGGGAPDVEDLGEPGDDGNVPPGLGGKKKKKIKYQSTLHQKLDEFVKETFGEESSYTPSPLFKGMALGSIALLNYQAQSLGAVEGFAEAGAMNFSPSDYAEFERLKKQQQISQRTSALGTATNFASTGAMVGLMGLDLFGPMGELLRGTLMGVVGYLSTTAQYYIGKSGAEDSQKAQIEATLDTNALRLSAAGISKRAKDTPTTSLSQLDDELMKSGTPVINSGEIVLGGRRDFTTMKGQLSQPGEMVDYVRRVSQLGAVMGTSDYGQLSFAITQMSALTGKSTKSVMDDMANSFTNYGGNVVNNYLKGIAISQSSNIPAEQAVALATKFQYDDPYLQSLVSRSMVMPMQSFISYHMLDKLGATKEEEDTLTLNKAHRDRLAYIHSLKGKYVPTGADMNLEIEAGYLSMASGGANIFASESGALTASKEKGDFSQTVGQKGFQQDLIDSLKNITTISASTVYLSGTVVKEEQELKPQNSGGVGHLFTHGGYVR